VTKGDTVVETFKGNSSANSVKLADYQYTARTYYQLEPYIRYDGAGNTPVFPDDYSRFNTFTSAKPTFTPASVNISSSDFAVYMDDQNAYNNSGAIQLSIDGGYYTKLSMEAIIRSITPPVS
jgi:hypothetical protein